MTAEPNVDPDSKNRFRATIAAAVAIGVLLLPAVAFYYLHGDGGGDRIGSLDMGWAATDETETCRYDEAAEEMTIWLRLRAYTTGPVDIIAEGIVTHRDENVDADDYTGHTKVTVDGTYKDTFAVTVDVPVGAYADGYTECMFSMRYNRGEPWD